MLVRIKCELENLEIFCKKEKALNTGLKSTDFNFLWLPPIILHVRQGSGYQWNVFFFFFLITAENGHYITLKRVVKVKFS